MRNLFVVALFGLFQLAFASTPEFRSEIWVHEYSGRTFEIQKVKRGILVRNDRDRDWNTFDLSYRDTYEDKYGNTIQVLSIDRLQYESRNGAKVFYLVPARNAHRNSFNHASVVGTWYSDHGKSMDIECSGSGIEVRRGRDLDRYFSEYEYDGVFTNREGNIIRIIDEDELVWKTCKDSRPIYYKKNCGDHYNWKGKYYDDEYDYRGNDRNRKDRHRWK